jgi:hypothetical protein
MSKKPTKYDEGFADGREYERSENLSVVKRAEQAKIHSVEVEVNKKLGELLGTSDENNIVTFNKEKGMVFLGGRKMETTEIANFHADAEFILESGLWKAIVNTVGNDARDRIFNRSETFQDVLNGKMALYNLDLIKKLLTIFKSSKK